MSENRFQAAYQSAQQRHDEVAREALDAVSAAYKNWRTWERRRPALHDRLARHLECLWKDDLGLVPMPRFRKVLPILPLWRFDRRLRRLDHKELGTYRNRLRRLGTADIDSWPARRLLLKISILQFRLWLTPARRLVVLLALVLLLVALLAPSTFEDLAEFVVGTGAQAAAP